MGLSNSSSSFHLSCGVVHRDLKDDNVLLTATEDVKLADVGLAREYTALKGIDDEGSWLTNYKQYYMNSGVGTIHWVAEFFTHHYTEKADVFSLGASFFAILERDCIVIDGKAIYGAFVNIHGEGKLGLGLAMAEFDSGISIKFASHAQGSNALQSVVLEALQYDKNDRPSAQEIYDKVMNIRRGVRRNQQPPGGEKPHQQQPFSSQSQWRPVDREKRYQFHETDPFGE